MPKIPYYFLIEPEQLDWAKKQAKKDDRSTSAYLRLLIKKDINENGGKNENKKHTKNTL